MSTPKSPTDYRDVVRYCYAIVVVASISATLLVASVFLRYDAEARSRDKLQRLHVRGLMLSNEISTRIAALRSEPDLRSRRSSVALASIAQRLHSIAALDDELGDGMVSGTIERARRRHTRVKAGIQAHSAPDWIATELDAFAVNARQLHQLHANAIDDSFAEMTLRGQKLAWQLAWIVGAVLLITGAIVLRLLARIRARLRAHLETERTLRERERQLQHAQKIQALGTLVGGVAHDFNNLLTAILGHAQFLTSALPAEHSGTGAAKQILKASERAADLTRQLLAFGRYEIAARRSVDLNAAVHDVEPLLRRLVREDIALVVECGEGVGHARLDQTQLEQVLMNLVTNARDAIARDGRISIRTESVVLGPAEAENLDLAPGPYARLSVEDDGCGMSAELRSRIFEPFFTTKEFNQGTGLGLSIVYGIAAGCGGKVFVESEPGQGTRFDLCLPQVEAHAEKALGEADGSAPRAGSETILLVEDEDMVREFAAAGLREHGYDVLVTSNGSEALDVCRTPPRPIHVIVTDVVLPGLRGPELVEQARTLVPDAGVVYMSGYSEEELLDKVRDSRHPFVPKPFRLEELLAAIRAAADRAGARNGAGPGAEDMMGSYAP